MKLTKELTDKLCLYIRKGNFIETACRACGLHPATYFQWRQFARYEKAQKYIDFGRAVEEAETALESELVSLLVEKAKDGPREITEFLARRFRPRWGRDAANEIRTLDEYDRRHGSYSYEEIEPDPDDPRPDDPETKYRRCDLVTLKSGVTDPQFPHLDMGGWSGIIHEVNHNTTPPSYLVHWDEGTLARLPVEYVLDSELNGLEGKSYWVGEGDIEPREAEEIIGWVD